MDAVLFVPEPVSRDVTISIRVNGRDLRDLAAEVERPYAAADGDPGLAGSYEGLHVWAIDGAVDHFLGEPRASWFEDGDTVLLGCTCGEWGCWPLVADITVGGAGVTWTRFRNGHRDWDLSALGPFEFDRVEYTRQVRALAEALAQVPSPEG